MLRSQSEDEDDRGKRNRVSQAKLLVDKYDSSKMCFNFQAIASRTQSLAAAKS